MILDSGNRTEFGTGAVRDLQQGKGRCDLLPLEVIENLVPRNNGKHLPVSFIEEFVETGDIYYLYNAIHSFCEVRGWDVPTMSIEVSIHFEDGATKYGENNWQKGIPVHCYINSGVRHYLKWMRGDNDEPHDRAFCWNMMCAIWTCINLPELNEYKRDANETKE